MGHHLLDVADISLDILQIPTEHHPRFSYSMGTLLDVCQISFPSLLAIGPGLLGVQITGGRIQQIDHLLYQFPGVVQQSDIRRIMDICRTTGRVKDQRSTVLRSFRWLCRERVLAIFLINGIIFLGVIHGGNRFWRKNQIVDPLDHPTRDALPEMCHHGFFSLDDMH